jgi:hypothetical protein
MAGWGERGEGGRGGGGKGGGGKGEGGEGLSGGLLPVVHGGLSGYPALFTNTPHCQLLCFTCYFSLGCSTWLLLP